MERLKQRQLLPPLSVNDRSLVQPGATRRESFASARTKYSQALRGTNRSDGFVQKRASVTPMKSRPVATPIRARPTHTRFLSSVDLTVSPKPVECPWQLSEIKIARCIGQGSLGRVFLGEVDSLEVAVKVIEKSSTKVKRVAEAEKTILEKVKHALMVRYYGCIQDSEKVHLVMEYLPKGDLFHLMKRHRLKAKEVRFYAAEAAFGLKYMHDRKIVYRDLKPENLMLSSTGHIKFIDFGFSKQLVADRTTSVLGSPEYMAPELVMKRPHGLPVDCWSFGILLFELWSHHPPFRGSSPHEVYERIIEGTYEIPSHVDAAAKDLVRKLLNPEAKFRPNIDQVMAHPYFQDIDWTLVDQLQLDPPSLEGVTERTVAEYETDLFDT